MLYSTGSANQDSGDGLEGQAEGWGGREVLEGGGICISMADSHCRMAETKTSL